MKSAALTLILLLQAALPAADSSYLSSLPTGERWLEHMNDDLLPFWTMPSALGNPLGAFPSVRCDDGSLVDFNHPCAPIAGNAYLSQRARYLVTLCRQTYGYGVAYHLTGDLRYLMYTRAGIDYIRQHAIDPAGGMYTAMDLSTGLWGPQRELRDAQQMGYSLLAMTFYYYLTRDAAVLQDLLRVKDYIFSNYFNQSMGTMQWQLSGASAYQKHLVSDLDQMNTYLVLMAPLLPEPYQTQWKQTLTMDARSILGTFYSPSENLVFLMADTPQQRDLAYTGIDVGHSAKALWMIRFAGQITGDRGLVNFAEARTRGLFERVYIPEADGSGSWAGGVQAGGALDRNKNAWVYCELDQLAGTLALVDVELGRYLPQTTDYWFRYFVDQQYGEVWNGVNYADKSPQRDYPKAWQWKNMYHDFEHVLVGYITSQWLHGEPAVLHYAFQQPVDSSTIHPYFFSASIDSMTTTQAGSVSYLTVTFHPPEIGTRPLVELISSASYLPGPLAAGSLASAWGTQLATSLADTTVTVTDSQGATRAAAASYASPSQVNFRIPPGTAAGAASVVIRSADGADTTIPAEIAAVAPGIFQLNSQGLAAAEVVRVKPDLSQTIENVYQVGAGDAVLPRPIDFGASTDAIYLALYGTGFANATDVTVTVGGLRVPITYAGIQGTYDGLDQINVGPLPRSLSGSGRVNIILTADGQTANPVELAVQ
jgi:uncharacterized protein (TIGR03437 family)